MPLCLSVGIFYSGTDLMLALRDYRQTVLFFGVDTPYLQTAKLRLCIAKRSRPTSFFFPGT